MHPELVDRYRAGRGPQMAPTKQLVSLRLDRDVLVHFRTTGSGWQTRINDVLPRAAKLEASSKPKPEAKPRAKAKSTAA